MLLVPTVPLRALNLTTLLILSRSTIAALLSYLTRLYSLLISMWSRTTSKTPTLWTQMTSNLLDFHNLNHTSKSLVSHILYIIKGTNILINSSIIESIIKSTYIFDNIHITLKLYIIKVSPKSDMSIVWIDI